MRLFIISLLLLSILSSTYAQPYAIGERQISFTDPARSNRVIDAEVFYPATTAGANTPVANGQFPLLVFGHGFLMVYSAYDVIWQALVPEGYIMVFPTTEGGLTPDHDDFGQDIAFLVFAMQQEAADSNSTFFNALDSTSAVMGHSMGGGSAFLAMQYNSNITAMATLAAAETNPSAVTAAAAINRPALVIAGANDCVTPPSQHQELMYNALDSASKHYVSITGASHCQFGSNNFFCSTGEATCSPSASISASAQQNITIELLLPFLNFYLKKECAAADQFQAYVDTASTITSNQSIRLACSTTTNIHHTKESSALELRVFPNPSADHAQLRLNELPQNAQVQIYNSLGQLVFQHSLQTNSIDLPQLPKGIYQLLILSEQGKLLGHQQWVRGH